MCIHIYFIIKEWTSYKNIILIISNQVVFSQKKTYTHSEFRSSSLSFRKKYMSLKINIVTHIKRAFLYTNVKLAICFLFKNTQLQIWNVKPSMLRISIWQYMLNYHGNTDSKEGKDTEYYHGPLLICKGLPVLQTTKDWKHFGGCWFSYVHNVCAESCAWTERTKKITVRTMSYCSHSNRIFSARFEIFNTKISFSSSVDLEKHANKKISWNLIYYGTIFLELELKTL